MPPEMLLPPGYLSLASVKGVMKAKGSITGGRQSIEALMEKGMFLCGSAETVRQQIEHYQQRVGFGYILPMMQFATLPADVTRRSMERFARDVMPHLRQLGES
jgi:alkanesulfonate monooxygenase SsuD/methylene tetrahydromethanopterin reductase-like flavin-dependent oxidoreductase (luciferase family)